MLHFFDDFPTVAVKSTTFRFLVFKEGASSPARVSQTAHKLLCISNIENGFVIITGDKGQTSVATASFLPWCVWLRLYSPGVGLTHYSSPVWRCRCIGCKKVVKTCQSTGIIFQLRTCQEASLCVWRTVLEAGLKHCTLVARAAVLSGHDISQSHAVWQRNASPFFLSDLFICERKWFATCWMTFTCSEPVLLKTKTNKKKKRRCWELNSPVVSKG